MPGWLGLYDPLDVPIPVDDAFVGNDLSVGGDILVGAVRQPKIVRTDIDDGPPLTPVDGDIWVAEDVGGENSGVAWAFIYNADSSSGFKWEFIGGSALLSEVAATEASASTTYTDLTTVGPDVTAPRAGDYIIEHGFHGFQDVAARQVRMSYAIGGTAAVDADSAETDSDATSHLHAAVRVARKNGLAASTLLRAKYRTNTSGSGTWLNRFLRVTPVRVT